MGLVVTSAIGCNAQGMGAAAPLLSTYTPSIQPPPEFISNTKGKMPVNVARSSWATLGYADPRGRSPWIHVMPHRANGGQYRGSYRPNSKNFIYCF